MPGPIEQRIKERITDRQMAGFRAVMEAIADVTDVNVRESGEIMSTRTTSTDALTMLYGANYYLLK